MAAPTSTAVVVALAVAVALLLIALATASLLAWAYVTAHRDATADLAAVTAQRDEARRDLRTAHRVERELRAELSVLRRLAEQRAVATAALTPDADTEPPARRRRPTLTEEWMAYLGELPLTYPGDPR